MMSGSRLLEGMNALVTGASRGIGKQTAEELAKHGANVLVNARAEGAVDELCSRLAKEHSVEAIPLYFDVCDSDQVRDAFSTVFRELKRLDVVVNNAGVLRDAVIGMTSKTMINEVFDVNLYGVLYCCQYAARLMSRQKSGSIVNMSSIIGRVGNEGQAVYAASKAGVIGITKSLAKELAPLGIRVNAVAPGFIETDMIKSVPEDKFERIKGNIKMGRLGQPQDVANVVVFLASPLSAYVTGQVIGVDGGMLV